MSDFCERLAEICRAEYGRWDDGRGRETQGTDQAGIAKDYYLFVRDYWRSIGINHLDGRTIEDGIRPAWSSAFVSYCVRKAGASAQFKYSQAHCHYIAAAMAANQDAASTYGYRARRYETYKPKVGDIICGGREYAKTYTYDQAKLIYTADSFYPSHGDIVVAMTDDQATVIGGNITNNVDRKHLRLNDAGFLRRRVADGGQYPWITVLECVI